MPDLVDTQGRIIYDNVLEKYPWIVAENQKCILSPDCDGKPKNVIQKNNTFSLNGLQQDTAVKFLTLLSTLTGWQFDKSKWSFDNFSIFQFTKGTTKPNQRNFDELLAKNPLSWAQTSTLAIEYTLEEPDKMKI
ncbi:hypothetical protein FACS1894170_10820 [Planctomycetales bacterium]|nr:hypothetical protein FACS1894170_10820 [Planctomycetales bacterium]